MENMLFSLSFQKDKGMRKTFLYDLGGGGSLASRLRSLSSESFVQLLAAVFNIVLVMYAQVMSIKKPLLMFSFNFLRASMTV